MLTFYRKMIDEMRRTVSDLIISKKQKRKLKDEVDYRVYKQEEKDMKEILKYQEQQKKLKQKKSSSNSRKKPLNQIDQDRVYKLLSRGMPSENYKMQAKSLY